MAQTVLMTGASSFTGIWIAEALAAAGFAVIAPLQRRRADYEGVRRERVLRLERVAQAVFDCPFGTAAFNDLIGVQSRIDAFAHHGAHMVGYRDPSYDVADAVRRNTQGALESFRALGGRGAQVVIATGTVFEAGEGGSPDHPGAVTPYGEAKTLSNIAFAQYAAAAGLRFGRFVIPSPYGVFEERRFSWHLFRSWFAGETPTVRTPLYVRDHIPAPMLAAAYASYLATSLAEDAAPAAHRPSGWIAPQGEFGRKIAAEAALRLDRECPLILAAQTILEEPLVRVNIDPARPADWNEPAFWDAYVDWYSQLASRGELA